MSVEYYTNINIPLYVKSTDSASGKAKYSFNGGLTLQSDLFKTHTKNDTAVVILADGFGNMSEAQAKSVDNIDKIEPHCSITVGSDTVKTYDNNYYWDNIPVKLSRDDNPATSDYAKSGTRYYGSIASSSLNYNGLDYDEQTKDTLRTDWCVYVKDRAGNTK